jgi:peroxiredoxin
MENAPTPEVGQEAPDFRLKGPGGAPYMLSEYRGDKNVLLVFYPLAFSAVCSHQLPEIQAALPRFAAAETVVFGISVDSHYANAAFARSLGVSFPLLSDFKREAAAAYGVLIEAAGYSGRASFLIDKQGLVAWRDVSDNLGSIEQIPSVEQALATLAALAKS